jgi:hypothetical protein
MDSMAFPIFSIISAAARFGFDNYMSKAYIKLTDAVFLIALVVETAYVTHYGFLMAFQKSSENVANPNLRELLYHVITVIVILGLLKSGTAPLDAIMALRTMVVGSLTGSYTIPGGQQSQGYLSMLDVAMSFSNVVNSVSNSGAAPAMKSTAVTLSLVADASPQIAAGLLLLMNELMVRLGMALFPLVFYALLYKISRGFFMTWLNLMFSTAIELAAGAVLIKLAAEVTVIFVATLGGLELLNQKLPIGAPYFSEMQQSVIQACFGVTLSALLFWAPSNLAAYGGTVFNNGMLKPNIGNNVAPNKATSRKIGSNREALKSFSGSGKK